MEKRAKVEQFGPARGAYEFGEEPVPGAARRGREGQADCHEARAELRGGPVKPRGFALRGMVSGAAGVSCGP
jgi:hypothetical protein